MAKAIEVAKVIYQAPNLDVMEKTMVDFGLKTVHRTADRLYMRGADTQHHIHETRLGDTPRFIGAAVEMSSLEDLEELARLENSHIEKSDEPGGGYRFSMFMPDGFEISAIWGREKQQPLVTADPNLFNAAEKKERFNSSIRGRAAIAPVMRLGHFVLHVTNHDESVKWLKERFAFIDADYFAPPGQTEPIVGTFLRCDLGEQYVDHHCMLILQAKEPEVHHTSYELQDLDAVMRSHDYLLQQGWNLDCGVGRHLLGSQIFDYWKDPFGFRIEHYTDGDLVNNQHTPTVFNGTAQDTTQWGMEPPSDFFL